MNKIILIISFMFLLSCVKNVPLEYEQPYSKHEKCKKYSESIEPSLAIKNYIGGTGNEWLCKCIKQKAYEKCMRED